MAPCASASRPACRFTTSGLDEVAAAHAAVENATVGKVLISVTG